MNSTESKYLVFIICHVHRRHPVFMAAAAASRGEQTDIIIIHHSTARSRHPYMTNDITPSKLNLASNYKGGF